MWSGELGFAPDQLWRQTPRTLAAIVEGRTRLANREHDQRAWLAWHTAALQRVKKLPKLRELLAGNRQRKRGQSIDEMIAAAKAWDRAVNRR